MSYWHFCALSLSVNKSVSQSVYISKSKSFPNIQYTEIKYGSFTTEEEW